MKIVVVGQHYWPENFLINDIAENLVKRGYQVTVITGLPNYPKGIIPKEYRFFRRRHEIRNGVEIYRVPIIARHHGFIFRVLNYISFWFTSSIFARFHKFEADVIMSYQTAPIFMANAAIVLKKKLNKPLFFYCLDIWPDQMKVWNVGEKNPAFMIVHRYCRYAYNCGDIVAVSSRPFIDYLVRVNHVDANKIVYLPQHSAKMKIGDVKISKTCINLIFAGNIGKMQNVECILKAVSMINTKKAYHVHIYGGGTNYELCKNLADDLKINDRVTFYGIVSKEELNRIYSEMDAFLLTLGSVEKFGFAANTVPAKLQGYMSAEKPIIASIDGGAREIIGESGCGVAVAADDVEGYAGILTDFIENPEKYKECGERALKYFTENFDEKIIMDKLEGYLKQLAEKN